VGNPSRRRRSHYTNVSKCFRMKFGFRNGVRGNGESGLLTHTHLGHGLVPSSDNLPDTYLGDKGVVTIPRRVEPVHQYKLLDSVLSLREGV